MNESNSCPFCSPSLEDIVILETEHSRVICDSRPIMIGHVLVTSKKHIASALDLDAFSYWDLQLTQQEISYRIWQEFGEVGIYEHGRSMLCRFHNGSYGHVHAHLHTLPASSDLLERSGYEHKWISKPSKEVISENSRYLYQQIGKFPKETWGTGSLPILRHFVRSELQDSLKEQRKQWIPLESSPDDHDEAVEQTAFLLSNKREQQYRSNCIEIISTQDDVLNEIVKIVTPFTTVSIIDVRLIYQALTLLAYKLGKKDTDTLLKKANLLFSAEGSLETQITSNSEITEEFNQSKVFDSTLNTFSAYLYQDPKVFNWITHLVKYSITQKFTIVLTEQPNIVENASLRIFISSNEDGELKLKSSLNGEKDKILTQNEDSNFNTYIPTWKDFRIFNKELKPKEIIKLIYTAWKLRSKEEIPMSFI